MNTHSKPPLQSPSAPPLFPPVAAALLRWGFGACIGCLSVLAVGGAAVPATDAQIRQALADRVDRDHAAPGIVVGVVDAKGSRFFAHGHFAGADTPAVDPDTVFEIGSATKVFTSLLLAEAVGRKEVALDTKVAELLPAEVRGSARAAQTITLLGLATHHSGLPRLPDNLVIFQPGNPYADYTPADLYEFLAEFPPPADTGIGYAYSNLGAGLLGHLLALRAGTNYEALVRARITAPLGMSATAITLSPALRDRLAPGHAGHGVPAANWDLPTLAGAGALRSSARDLLVFLAANLGLRPSPLLPAMRLQREPRAATDSAVVRIGLGWHLTTKAGATTIWHNGQTGGYHSFLAFDPAAQRGVVVLANSTAALEDLGGYVLDVAHALSPSPVDAGLRFTPVPPAVLAARAGRYQLTPQVFFNVRPSGDHLEARLTGQSYLALYPASPTEFFYSDVDARITFEPAAGSGKAALVLHQNGRDQRASKLADAGTPDPVPVRLDSALYDRYAGRYELVPEAVFTLHRRGDHLVARLTGQSYLEVLPSSATEFFYRDLDARLSFEVGAGGAVKSLTLHQNGRDQKARRLP